MSSGTLSPRCSIRWAPMSSATGCTTLRSPIRSAFMDVDKPMTDAQKLAAVLELLRKRVASGDVRAQVLREVEAIASRTQ